MILLEVCVDNIESLLAAKEGGANRVELCSNLAQGGTTPPYSLIKKSVQISDLQIFVLIRPRPGDFLYTENEFIEMKEDIIKCGEIGCHGVVIGILTKYGEIDIDRNSELIGIAKKYGMQVTFHRAIDRTKNIFDSMENIIDLGFDRILTSSGEKSVPEGKKIIRKMIDQAGNRITIIPGGGITEDNIYELKEYLNTQEFHGSFRKERASEMEYKKIGVDKYENEYTILTTCSEKVREAVYNANKSVD